MEVRRRESEAVQWEFVRRPPQELLRPYLLGGVEGWAQGRGEQLLLREVPFPGIPLIFNLGAAWEVDDPGARQARRHDSFLAGLHTGPALVRSEAASWSCLELRLTPLGAHRLLGVAMHELANETFELEEVLPDARGLSGRLREAPSWNECFDLVEEFLLRRLVNSAVAPSTEVEWSWQRLNKSHGVAPIAALADELGWSHRRLISRFREQIGLAPKALARVIRFDHAVSALRSSSDKGLAEVALACGYFDQQHLNREFRELAGTTPTAFRAAQLETGGVAA